MLPARLRRTAADRSRHMDVLQLGSYLPGVAIDVYHLPAAAEQLADLTQRERDVLALLGEGLASREIAERLELSESTVYLVIADLLDALEYEPPSLSADEIHARAGTRAASASEIARFHGQFGPFDTDSEG